MALHNLVSEILVKSDPGVNAKGETTEGKSYTYFSLDGFVHEVVPTKKEKASGKRTTIESYMMSKGSFLDICDVLESIQEDIQEYDYKKLVRLSEKKLGPGLSLWIDTTQAKLDQEYKNGEAPIEFFRGVLASVIERSKELSKVGSVADPYLDCKRRFTKTDKYANLLVCQKTPVQLVHDNIDQEIRSLLELKEKAAEVSSEDYLSFLQEKFASNGIDKNGMVMLRDTSDKDNSKSADKGEEKAEEKAENILS